MAGDYPVKNVQSFKIPLPSETQDKNLGDQNATLMTGNIRSIESVNLPLSKSSRAKKNSVVYSSFPNAKFLQEEMNYDPG